MISYYLHADLSLGKLFIEKLKFFKYWIQVALYLVITMDLLIFDYSKQTLLLVIRSVPTLCIACSSSNFLGVHSRFSFVLSLGNHYHV